MDKYIKQINTIQNIQTAINTLLSILNRDIEIDSSIVHLKEARDKIIKNIHES